MMYKSEPTNITGDTIIGIDTIPAVKSFKPIVRQKAVLKKRDLSTNHSNGTTFYL